jgi:hypothetical protein
VAHDLVAELHLVLEVAERLMAPHRVQMGLPFGWILDRVGGEIEPAQPDPARRIDAELADAIRHEGEAQVRPGLPIPVRRGLREIAKAGLAIAQRRLGALQARDVAHRDQETAVGQEMLACLGDRAIAQALLEAPPGAQPRQALLEPVVDPIARSDEHAALGEAAQQVGVPDPGNEQLLSDRQMRLVAPVPDDQPIVTVEQRVGVVQRVEEHLERAGVVRALHPPPRGCGGRGGALSSGKRA